MKRVACFIVFVAVVSMAMFAQGLPRLAVFEFNISNERLKEIAITVRDLVESHMAGMPQYEIITRNEIDVILENEAIEAHSISSGETISDGTKEGLKLAKINYIISGSVNEMFGEYLIIVRLLDVSSGRYPHSDRQTMGGNVRDFENGMAVLMGRFTAGILDGGPRVYRVGDTGPGRGIIFYAENGSYKEVSLTLGAHNWYQAGQVARNYRGGGFNDWRLPSLSELGMIYDNLRSRNLGAFGNDNYWASEQFGNDKAFLLMFGKDHEAQDSKSSIYLVRAVRDFR